jgi:UDP-glucose 4-epimerase
MHALITGGAGFIGHHLAQGLLAEGHSVSVLDDLSSGMLTRLDPVIDRIRFVEGSILDPSALGEAMEGCEVVFHEAAVASVARSVAEPRRTDEVNVGGTIDVMLAAQRHGVRRVVFASSSAVYGMAAEQPCREDQRPEPTSPYGITKLAGEHYLHVLGTLLGVESVALRYFNVFGPGQDPESEYSAVIPRFATTVLDGRPPTINGSGSISRDFVFVADVVRANILASLPTTRSGLTCNVATGEQRTLTDLLDAICAAVGRRIEPVIGPPRPGDIRDSVADITVAGRELGYRPTVSFGEGIAATVGFYRTVTAA